MWSLSNRLSGLPLGTETFISLSLVPFGDLAVKTHQALRFLSVCRDRAGVIPTPQNSILKPKNMSPCQRGMCTRRKKSSRM